MMRGLYVVIFIGPQYTHAYGPYGRGKAQYAQRFMKRHHPECTILVRKLIT